MHLVALPGYAASGHRPTTAGGVAAQARTRLAGGTRGFEDGHAGQFASRTTPYQQSGSGMPVFTVSRPKRVRVIPGRGGHLVSIRSKENFRPPADKRDAPRNFESPA
jgi:hypothetical protein